MAIYEEVLASAGARPDAGELLGDLGVHGNVREFDRADRHCVTTRPKHGPATD